VDRQAAPRMDAGGAGFLAIVALKSYHLDKSHTLCGAVAGFEELGQCGLKVSLLGWRTDETAYSDGAPKGGARLAGPRKHHDRSCGNLENHSKNRGISQVPHDVRFEALLKRRID